MFNSDSLPSFVFLSALETRLDASDEASDDDGGDDDDDDDDYNVDMFMLQHTACCVSHPF